MIPVRGIDAERVSAWLEQNIPDVAAPFEFRLITGGRSNLTFEVADAAGRRMVLRRPPLGQVLASAHDMGREHRIIAALDPTPVPVPAPLGFCGDEAVNGAPFHVMGFASGVILKSAEDAERHFGEDERALIGPVMMDVLAGLHAVDPDAVGLGDLGRREGYVERQLRRWRRQFEASKRRENPVVEEAHRRLAARVPVQARLGIVHGDFRIDNIVLAPDGSVTAVLDWELCTLGDPLADLGLLMVYWLEAGEDSGHMLIGTPTTLPGFATRAELLERYVERTGADVGEIDFYTALGYWKLACIVEGIYARYSAGVMGEDGVSADQLEDMPAKLAGLGLEILERGR